MSSVKETQPLLAKTGSDSTHPSTTAPIQESTPAGTEANTKLVLFSVALLLTSVGNSVFFKQMTDHMMNYPFFLSQLSTVIYIPVFFGIVFLRWSEITPEMKAFPKMKFFYMGLFDALSGVLSMIGAVHTSGGLQALLSNAIIPITMLLSFLYIGERFNFYQISGSGLITIAVILAVVPLFLGQGGDDENNGDNQIVFVSMFVLNNIPSAFGSVYKEIVFSQMDMNENFLQAWVALFQLVLGVALIPLNTLKMLGRDAVDFSEIGGLMYRGFWCLLGYNMIVRPHCIPFHDMSAISQFVEEAAQQGSAVSSLLPPCDICDGAWVPTSLYLGINLLYNWLMVVIIKVPGGGAALLYIIMALRLPLLQLAFASSYIQSPPEPITLTNVLVLALILLGLYLYNSGGGTITANAARLNINWIKVDSIQKEYGTITAQEQTTMIRNEWISTILPGGTTPGTGLSGGEIRRKQEREMLEQAMALKGKTATTSASSLYGTFAPAPHADGYSDDDDDSGNIDNHIQLYTNSTQQQQQQQHQQPHSGDTYLHIDLNEIEGRAHYPFPTPSSTPSSRLPNTPQPSFPPTTTTQQFTEPQHQQLQQLQHLQQQQQPHQQRPRKASSVILPNFINQHLQPSIYPLPHTANHSALQSSDDEADALQNLPVRSTWSTKVATDLNYTKQTGGQSPAIAALSFVPPVTPLSQLPPSTLLNNSTAFATKQGNPATPKFMATSAITPTPDMADQPLFGSTPIQSPVIKPRVPFTASTPVRSSRARHGLSTDTPSTATPVDSDGNSTPFHIHPTASAQLGAFQGIKPPPSQLSYFQSKPNPSNISGLSIFANSAIQTSSVRLHTADPDGNSTINTDDDTRSVQSEASPFDPQNGCAQVALIDGSNPQFVATSQLSSVGRSTEHMGIKSTIPTKLKSNKKPVVSAFSGVTATTLNITSAPTSTTATATISIPAATSTTPTPLTHTVQSTTMAVPALSATSSTSSRSKTPLPYPSPLTPLASSPNSTHATLPRQTALPSQPRLSNHKPPSGVALTTAPAQPLYKPSPAFNPTSQSNSSFNNTYSTTQNAITTPNASKSTHFQPQPTPQYSLSQANTPILAAHNPHYHGNTSNVPNDLNLTPAAVPGSALSLVMTDMTDLDLDNHSSASGPTSSIPTSTLHLPSSITHLPVEHHQSTNALIASEHPEPATIPFAAALSLPDNIAMLSSDQQPQTSNQSVSPQQDPIVANISQHNECALPQDSTPDQTLPAQDSALTESPPPVVQLKPNDKPQQQSNQPKQNHKKGGKKRR